MSPENKNIQQNEQYSPSPELGYSSEHKRQLADEVLYELREQKERPYTPTKDVDMVWVLSAPGTVKTESSDGVYAESSSDLLVVNHGVELVRQITALRLDKEIKDVTKDDIRWHGPKLFYNGEDSNTLNHNYSQNEDLAELIANSDFPIPVENIIIDHIDTANTTAQFEGLARYLSKNPDIAKKIVMVSIGAHSARVSRYLEKYKDDFADDIIFENSPSLQTHNPVGTTLRELRKVIKYSEMGHMSETPYDFKKNNTGHEQ